MPTVHGTFAKHKNNCILVLIRTKGVDIAAFASSSIFVGIRHENSERCTLARVLVSYASLIKKECITDKNKPPEDDKCEETAVWDPCVSNVFTICKGFCL